MAAALDANIDAYYREFEAGPLTLLHGDSHLGNTYSLPDGRSGLLDWQVIWRGPGLREVTYWMITGLEPDDPPRARAELLERYLDGLRAGGVDEVPTYDEAFDRYRLFSAEAWDATAMTIAWPGLQAPENAEAGWRRACVAVEDLDTADAVNESREVAGGHCHHGERCLLYGVWPADRRCARSPSTNRPSSPRP